MNPFAYFQNLKYMRPDFVAHQKLNDSMKERQWKKESNEKISMEQLLNSFGTQINVPFGE